jgi:hypothetical protein
MQNLEHNKTWSQKAGSIWGYKNATPKCRRGQKNKGALFPRDLVMRKKWSARK